MIEEENTSDWQCYTLPFDYGIHHAGDLYLDWGATGVFGDDWLLGYTSITLVAS
jgi:hypothetical protein